MMGEYYQTKDLNLCEIDFNQAHHRREYIQNNIIDILKQKSYKDIRKDVEWTDNDTKIIHEIIFSDDENNNINHNYCIHLYFSNASCIKCAFFPYDEVYFYSKREEKDIVLNWENAIYKTKSSEYEPVILLNPSISDDEFCQTICNFF